MKPTQVQKAIQKLQSQPDDVLVLAGDIGNPYSQFYQQFMEHVNQTFRKTFVITGNHEYYSHGHSLKETNQYLYTLFQNLPNISFLDNSSEVFEGVHFIGTTLWSYIENPTVTINDTIYIREMTIETYNEAHKLCRAFLEKALQETTTNKNIIITHHMPSYDLIDKQYRIPRMEPYNQWFATDLNEMIESNKYRIKCWIYGHTHTPSEQILQGIPMLCNTVGYPDSYPIKLQIVNYCKQFDV
jgi:predicted phosphohydrolase